MYIFTWVQGTISSYRVILETNSCIFYLLHICILRMWICFPVRRAIIMPDHIALKVSAGN